MYIENISLKLEYGYETDLRLIKKTDLRLIKSDTCSSYLNQVVTL